ncbi:MAG: nicotinate-nucleotide adenylyltransferase [bacterium]
MKKGKIIQLIGVFGGTFNPVHNGHLLIAEEARKRLKLDKVVFIPSSYPPHKKVSGLVSGCHRLNMVRLAIKDNPFFDSSDIEVKRGGKSYSIETIKQLKKSFKEGAEFYFIMGADSILEFMEWKEWKELLELCNFVVTPRPGYELVGAGSKPALTLLKNKIRKILHNNALADKIIFLETGEFDISSTEIREKIKNGESVNYFVPKRVFEYIYENGLYQKVS